MWDSSRHIFMHVNILSALDHHRKINCCKCNTIRILINLRVTNVWRKTNTRGDEWMVQYCVLFSLSALVNYRSYDAIHSTKNSGLNFWTFQLWMEERVLVDLTAPKYGSQYFLREDRELSVPFQISVPFYFAPKMSGRLGWMVCISSISIDFGFSGIIPSKFPYPCSRSVISENVLDL